MRTRSGSLLPVMVAVVVALASIGPAEASISKPKMQHKLITFGSKRKAQMEKYAERHYDLKRWELKNPQVIVEHFTGSSTWQSAWNTFEANKPDLGEMPGVCAHFLVDTDGTIIEVVDTGTMCRHTVGLNYTAIGIENVGTSDRQILHRGKQMAASMRLTAWLMQTYHIDLDNVIGHNESLTSSFHFEKVASWRCQTHDDWNRKHMNVYRDRLHKVLDRNGIPKGDPNPPVSSNC